MARSGSHMNAREPSLAQEDIVTSVKFKVESEKAASGILFPSPL